MYNKVQKLFENILEDYHYSWVVNMNVSGKSYENQIKDSINFILSHHEAANDEIEQKILEVDVQAVEKKLLEYWAKKVYDGNIEDNRYDFENFSFKKDKMILRLRQTDKGSYITLKKQNQTDNLNDKWISWDYEYEKHVDDINEIKDNMHQVWLHPLQDKNYKKHRIEYVLWDVYFAFDKYDNIPWLLEIESDHEQKVDEWKHKLWLDNHHTVQYWYRKLKKLYGVDNK